MRVRNLLFEQVENAVRINGDSSPYLLSMWRYAIDHATEDYGAVSCCENCDAIPYVPVFPEALGVPLDAESCVLDIGCLGGYGLYDFFLRRERGRLPLPRAFGIDIDAESVAVAKALGARWAEALQVRFEVASCTAIPLGDGTADLVVARLVLPYVALDAAVNEFGRVLKPGGAILVQVHAPRYYWKRLWRAFPHVKRMVYFTKPLVAGMIFSLTGWQVCGETALGRKCLQKLFAGYGFVCSWEGGFDSKPVMAFRLKI